MTLKRISCLLFCLLTPLTVHSEITNPYSIETHGGVDPIANLNGEPSAIVNNAVNVITGHYNDSQIDLVIPGAEPLIIQRHYTSSYYDEGSLCHGWNINHFGEIYFDGGGKDTIANVYENGKPKTRYVVDKVSKKETKLHVSAMAISRGVTNCSSGVIGGCTNIKNKKLLCKDGDKYCTLHSTCGDQAIYKRKTRVEAYGPGFFLDKVELVTGNQIDYRYDDQYRMSRIKTVGPDNSTLARAEFYYSKTKDKEHKLKIFPGDGRVLKYTFFKAKSKDSKGHTRHLLMKVTRSDAPDETYHYDQKDDYHLERVIRKNRPDNRYLIIDYYDKGKNYVLDQKLKIKSARDIRMNRVSMLKAPVGVDSNSVVTHTFFYESKKKHSDTFGGTTKVYDALGHRTDYEYGNSHRLRKINKYQGIGTPQLYTVENLYWGGEGVKINLKSRTFADANDHLIFCRYFVYDKKGNIIKDTLFWHLRRSLG